MLQPPLRFPVAAPWRWLLLQVLAAPAAVLVTAAGCGGSKPGPASARSQGDDSTAPAVTVVHPERKLLRRAVRQPGTVRSYERTPIYAKLPGYVEDVRVDYGDRVKKGDVLAVLSIPEMDVELLQKEALVRQAESEVEQAEHAAAAAEKAYLSAVAKVKETQSTRLRARAEHRRMKTQYERLNRVGQNGLLDRESIDETRHGAEAAAAGVQEVGAKVESAEANRDSSKAQWAKAQADVRVARAKLKVATRNQEHVQALLKYTRLTAPFDGVVTQRDADTGHLVQPATAGKGGALFVVERRDLMRIRVDVPESDADWVARDAQAVVRIQALGGCEFPGKVARTSYSLDPTARTLMAEIELKNPKDQLRPGMYAYATITVELPAGLTIPSSAVQTVGDVLEGYKSYCFLVEDGKARRTRVEVGARGTDRVEVLRKQVKTADGKEKWEPFTGQELVVQGNLAELHDGQAVAATAAGK
jgi:RND family efflux transporter MFP subunit